NGYQGTEQEHHDREPGAVEKQHRYEHEKRKGIEKGQEQAASHEFADERCLLHVLDQHAGRALLEEGDRQVEQVLEGAGRYAEVDAVGGKDQQIAPQKDKGGIKKQRDADTGREHIERGIALVHEHRSEEHTSELQSRENL